MVVLHQHAVVVEITHHRDAEEEAPVLEAFPPDRGAGSRDLHADRLSDLEIGVGLGEAVGVGVVALVHHHDRRLGPAVRRLLAEVLAARHGPGVGLAGEEDRQGFDEIPAVVEARVEDDALFLDRLAEDVLEDLPVPRVAHGSDVGVAETPAGQSLEISQPVEP